MTEADEFLKDCLARIYSPRSGLNAWEWGQKWVKLDSRESIDFQGPWDAALTPYVRFLMEFVTGQFSENVEFHPSTPPDAEWEEFILMKSSQLGFTLALLIVLAFWISEIKQNALLSLDSLEEMRKVAKSRLRPLLESCEPTRAALDEAEDEQSNLTIFLNALTVYLLGSHGAGSYRNKSVGLALLDELDAYKVTGADGSDPLGNARARLKAVGGGKLITTSSPETESHPTATEEKTGTRHRYFVPCPICAHYQELLFENLRFGHCKDGAGGYDLNRLFSREVGLDGIPFGVYYECELCHKPITEDHKPAMVAAGRWRQTNPKPKPGKISAQISDLYSPFKKASWANLASEFIEAQGNPTKLANFRKNRQGLPSKLQTDERTPDHIAKFQRNYLRGTIPVEPCAVLTLSDVQADVKKWVKVGFRPDGEMWVIDYGATLSFEELTLIAADPVPVGKVKPKSDPQRWLPSDGWEGLVVRSTVGLVDEGFIPDEVRKFCQRTIQAADGCQFFPSKGRGGIQVRLTVQESLTEAYGLPLRVYHYSDDDIKKLLYIARISRRIRPVPGLAPGPPINFPLYLSPEFKAELCSEKLTITREGGFAREEWKKEPNVPNDWGDALKLALVLWHVIAPLFVDWKPLSEIDATEQTAEVPEVAA